MDNLAIFAQLAEERIREAEENGAFDNLEGKGKPLALEDDSLIPEDLRMAYKVLKNSGHIPPELEADREIKNAADLLHSCKDEKTKYRQMQKLNYLMQKMSALRGSSPSVDEKYYDEIVSKISINNE